MPSTSKPQATLMAMAAHNPAFAKKKGIPVRVAKDFNRADKGGSMLKKAGGGPASMMGHALSGTQLGGPENLIRKAQDRFATFADGGAVKKPAGPSLKERREIRAMIEDGKDDAVSALRGMRSALINSQEKSPVEQPDPDPDTSLARLRSQLSMADGGEVDVDDAEAPNDDPAATTPNPEMLMQEYQELVTALQDESLPQEMHGQIIDRLASIESMLEQMGIDVSDPSS